MTSRPRSPLFVSLALVSLAAPASADSVTVTSGTGTVAVTSGADSVTVATAQPAYAEPAPEPVEVAPPPAVIVSAPPAPIARNTLGVDALAVVPVGDYANAADVGVGAGIRLEVPAGGGFITGRIGALFHSGAYDGNLTLVPAYAGYRQPIGTGGAYLAGELGITFAWATVDTGFGQATASDSEVGMLLSAGLRRGALDLRAGLFAPDLDDAVGLIGTAGYDFAAF